MGGFPAVPPQPYKNPVLDELDRLSPQAKDALSRAHQSIASIQAPPEAAPTPMQPAAIPGTPPRLASPPAYTPKPLGGTPAPGAAMPMTPEQQGHVSELNRITSSGSGVSQIHNPWARIPLQIADAIGSGLFPRIAMGIPGTEAHHQVLAHNAQSVVNADTAQREAEGKLGQEAAQTAHTQAQIPLAEADTALKQGQAAALPQVTADEHALKESQTGHNQAETQKLQAEAAPLGNVDQLNGMLEQRWQVLNPGHPLPPSYALKPGSTKVDYERVDKAMEATEKAAGTEAQRKATEELRHQTLALAQSNQEANRDLRREGLAIQAQNHHDSEAARGEVKMMIPGTNGQYTLQTFRAGDPIPQGAISPTGMNAMNTPTTQQRNVAAQASLVHEQTPQMIEQIHQLKDKIGPMAGRWNEFMQGKVGANDPQMADLRANLLMYSSAVALMHARGRLPENLREEFDHAINAPNQTAENLTATIKRIDDWTEKNMHAMGGRAHSAESNEPTMEQINAEVERRRAAKKGGK